jgi:hypothetical protein
MIARDADFEAGKLGQISFSYISGTLPVEDIFAFERIIFRATRGNVFTKFRVKLHAYSLNISLLLFLSFFPSPLANRSSSGGSRFWSKRF